MTMSNQPTYDELRRKVDALERQLAQQNTSLRKDSHDRPLTISEKAQTTNDVLSLKASEEKYRTLFEQMAQGIFIRQADGTVADCNQAALDMLGLEREEFIGTTYIDSPCTMLDEGGRSVPASQQPSVRALREKKPILNFVASIVHPHKQDKVWLSINAIPQWKTGNAAPLQVLVTLDDITAIRQVEQELRHSRQRIRDAHKLLQLVIDTIPVRLFWKDLDLSYLGCNRLFALDAGFSRPEQLIGLDDYTMGWREQAELYRNDDMEVIRTGRPKLHYEEPQTTPEGKKIWLSTSKVPLRDAEDNIVGLLGAYEDITARKQAEAKLLNVQKLESLGRLAGGIAHNFNNILMTIMGNISFAKMEAKPTERLYQRLLNAEQGCLKAKDLCSQFLTFSKGGAPVKIQTPAAHVIRANSQLALSGTRSLCEYALPPDLWDIHADSDQLGQVLTNLLLNADQAMPEGGIIRVSAKNRILEKENSYGLEAGNYVQILIEDHGTGIAEEDLPNIFDPYFTTKANGNGLGLASAYSIMQQHQGAITVESTNSSGTIFSLLLPAAASKVTVDTKQHPLPVKKSSGNILVMDDDQSVLHTIAAMLEHLGYTAHLVVDGEAAIRAYLRAMDTNSPFDVVIMDLVIPGAMGGEATARHLQEIDPKVKMIVSSGFSQDTIIANYEKYGFTGFVVKPYRLEELASLLRQVLGS